MEVDICHFLPDFTVVLIGLSEVWEVKDSPYTDNCICASGNSLGGVKCALQRADSSQSFTSALFLNSQYTAGNKTGSKSLIEQLAGDQTLFRNRRALSSALATLDRK